MKHTANRIVKMNKRNTLKHNVKQQEHIVLLSSWGLDGTSGQAQYNQKIYIVNNRDVDLLATAITLRLSSYINKDKIYWLNMSPQSVRFCKRNGFKNQSRNKNRNG